jgi:hypothetical protein
LEAFDFRSFDFRQFPSAVSPNGANWRSASIFKEISFSKEIIPLKRIIQGMQKVKESKEFFKTTEEVIVYQTNLSM